MILIVFYFNVYLLSAYTPFNYYSNVSSDCWLSLLRVYILLFDSLSYYISKIDVATFYSPALIVA
jgi:hypothetical protein